MWKLVLICGISAASSCNIYLVSAPSPVIWQDYDILTSILSFRWPEYPGAKSYSVSYTYKGSSYTQPDTLSTFSSIICDSNDASLIEVSYTAIVGESVTTAGNPITFMCAGKPGNISNLRYRTQIDTVIIEWDGVESTGFTEILGYTVYKQENENWVVASSNLPTNYRYDQKIDYGVTYYFKVSAYNWVGETISQVLSINLPINPDGSKSTITKPSSAEVLYELKVEATVFDTKGSLYTTPLILFLIISDLCTQSSSFLCERISPSSPSLLSKSLYLEMSLSSSSLYSVFYTPSLKGSYTFSVWLLQAGGLYAEYWDNIWFYGTPLVAKSERDLQRYWGENELITSNTGDYLSIRWQGMISPPVTEHFTIYGYADDAVRVWIDEELVVDSWNECCKEVTGTMELEKGKYYSIRIDYRQIIGKAEMIISWSSYSIPKQIIPADYLYSPQIINGAPWNVNVDTGKSTVSSCYNDPLSTITAGVSTFLNIYSVDARGNLYDNPLDLYSISITGPDTFSFSSTYKSGGKSSVTFSLTKSGVYTVSITLYSLPIRNSPFSLTVLPGAFSAATSTTDFSSILSLLGYLQAGVTYSITLTPRDSYSNLLTGFPSSAYFVLSFVDYNEYVSPINLAHPSNWAAIYGENYSARPEGSVFNIAGYRAGNYIANLFVGSTRLKEFPMNVRITPLGIYPLNSEAVYSTQFTAGNIVVIQIQCRDVYYNNIHTQLTDLATYSVTITGPETLIGTLTQISQGAFKADITLTKAGSYVVNIKLNGTELRGSGRNIEVSTGPSDPIEAVVQGFSTSIAAGQTGQVTVRTADSYKNPTAYSTDILSASVSATVTSEVLNPVVTSKSYGLFTVEFTPIIADTYSINLYLNSQPILGSPLTLSVSPSKVRGKYSNFSFIDPVYNITEALLLIESRDIYDNPIESPTTSPQMGNQFYQSSLLHLESSNLLQIQASYTSDYTQYLIDLSTISTPGNYSITLGLVQQDGLVAYYYRTPDFLELQALLSSYNHDGQAPESYTGFDQVIDIDWGLNPSSFFSPPLADFYAVKWEGWIYNRFTETVRFYVSVGDDELVRVSVNGEIVGDSLSGGTYEGEVQGSVELEGGQFYEIAIEYVEYTGEASIKMEWESDTFTREVVGKEYLYGLVNSDYSPYLFEMVDPNLQSTNTTDTGTPTDPTIPDTGNSTDTTGTGSTTSGV
jgi:hypothetical protein